ncbi:MAG: hypothetical protein CO189_05800 [candidate division Zixibacteria bacterium CG_4_9_14_3_um_filter_46_8]|nr:MAG: hypothetical protein CO189_05800 [candidate division Zixibacteria bacterium CG_4_9_14_3_um_filter_46_8]
MPQIIRLNAFLAHCGVCSRRNADQLISEGRIKVNGNITNVLGTKINVTTDEVELDGKAVRLSKRRAYYALNKPVGVITTMDDPEGRKTVGDYISEIGVHLYPVGRLDYDSEGLLLLTNDGEIAFRVQHPRYEIVKDYVVGLNRPLENEGRASILKGVMLDDGFCRIRSIKSLGKSEPSPEFQIEITEGRKRIIRRLFEQVGYEVISLKRIRVGCIRLGRLKSGAWRTLRPAEIRELRKLTGLE